MFSIIRTKSNQNQKRPTDDKLRDYSREYGCKLRHRTKCKATIKAASHVPSKKRKRVKENEEKKKEPLKVHIVKSFLEHDHTPQDRRKPATRKRKRKAIQLLRINTRHEDLDSPIKIQAVEIFLRRLWDHTSSMSGAAFKQLLERLECAYESLSPPIIPQPNVFIGSSAVQTSPSGSTHAVPETKPQSLCAEVAESDTHIQREIQRALEMDRRDSPCLPVFDEVDESDGQIHQPIQEQIELSWGIDSSVAMAEKPSPSGSTSIDDTMKPLGMDSSGTITQRTRIAHCPQLP
jgi:hypothetical protein